MPTVSYSYQGAVLSEEVECLLLKEKWMKLKSPLQQPELRAGLYCQVGFSPYFSAKTWYRSLDRNYSAEKICTFKINAWFTHQWLNQGNFNYDGERACFLFSNFPLPKTDCSAVLINAEKFNTLRLDNGCTVLWNRKVCNFTLRIFMQFL